MKRRRWRWTTGRSWLFGRWHLIWPEMLALFLAPQARCPEDMKFSAHLDPWRILFSGWVKTVDLGSKLSSNNIVSLLAKTVSFFLSALWYAISDWYSCPTNNEHWEHGCLFFIDAGAPAVTKRLSHSLKERFGVGCLASAMPPSHWILCKELADLMAALPALIIWYVHGGYWGVRSNQESCAMMIFLERRNQYIELAPFLCKNP